MKSGLPQKGSVSWSGKHVFCVEQHVEGNPLLHIASQNHDFQQEVCRKTN